MSTSHPSHAQYRDLHVLMDVVDTVRHAQEDARRLAGAEMEEEALVGQVLRIYASQGMEVDEATVREGLALMKERRFEFTPPRPSLATRLARIYITRSQWGPTALLATALLAVALGIGGAGLHGYGQWQESQWVTRASSSADDERRLRHQHDMLKTRAQELVQTGAHPKIQELAQNALATLEKMDALLSSLPALPDDPKAQRAVYSQNPDAAQSLTRARRQPLQKAFSLLPLAQGDVSQASALQEVAPMADVFNAQAPTDLDGVRQSLRLRFEEGVREGNGAKAQAAVEAWNDILDLDGRYTVLDGQAQALDPSSRQQAQAMLHEARVALVAGNRPVAESLLDGTRDALELLPVAYQLRIVNEAGEKTGVWRYYDNNRNQRSYFIVVDALDARGGPMVLPIKDVETGQIVRTSRFAVRVDESVYNAVGQDKMDDGIIDRPVFGTKRAGEMDPSYEYDTLGGFLTQW